MTLTCFPHLRYVLIAPLAALLFSAAAFAQQSAPALRHEAWMAYTRGAHRDAAASLQRSLALQLNSPATLLALMFHHQFRSNYDSAWWYFAKAMESHENPHAVMYAMLGDPLATRFTQNYRFRFEPMFRSVLAKPDPTGTLAAMIYERMGMYYQSIGDIASAKMMYDSMNAITDWIVIGPFENTSMCGFNKVYPPERSIIRSAEYDDRYCGKTSWFAPPAYRMDKWIDFERFFVTVNGVFYAATYVYSPATQRVQLRVGTSGGVKLFVNDATVLQDDREFNNDLDTYIAEAPLQQGWNKVLVKCMSNEITRCNFMLRITDAAGKPVAGLRTSTDEQSYTPVAKTDAVRIPNPFIAYFTKAYAADTTDYASLFLLANCHTRNDDGESAEMALHPVIKKYPTSTLLMTRMMAANIQNGKRDAALALLEQLYTVDSTAPDGLQNKILEAIRNKNLTELDILIPRRLAESTDEEEQYGLRIAHLTSRDNPEWESLAREAHEKFPYNPQFFSIRSSLLEKQSAGITALIALWEKYLTKNYTPTVLSTLASLYEQQNDVARWEKYRTLMQELENETPGFYLNTAERYLARENYDRAEKDVRRALQFCPSASRLYGVLATIERKRGNNDKAISHLRESLRRYPADFETRDQLRELEGKKPVAAVFGSFPVDTAIARAKKSNRFPDDQSAILIDDNKYVIYPEGTFEYRREQLVQILKQEGIDDWKEMNLGRFTTIEKAVTIKKNGTEIRADENNGELVFKQLQEGDFIYLRTKDLYNDGDRFQKHFSHREYFQGTLPMGVTRLAILAPPALKLTFRSLGINREPKTTQTPDGVLYEWQTEDVDAVQTEAMMPSASDVFNHVEISSIPSWSFIGEWYNDITTSKLRSSYEIREKIQELFGGENPGEEKVIERIYRFITDSVRYSLVPFRQSGYVPQSARDVLITRIGDCKDVATLGIVMLREMGIAAQYVLVKTNSSTSNHDLPSRDFDHVIIRVATKQGYRYLDLTANNFPIGTLPPSDYDAASLLIPTPDGEGIKRLNRTNFAPSTISVLHTMSVTPDGAIDAQRRTTYSGVLSAFVRGSYRNVAQKELEKSITEGLGSEFPDVELKGVSLTGVDTLAQQLVINEEFNAPRYVSTAGGFMILKLPWLYKTSSDEAFSYPKRSYPLDIDFSYDSCYEELRVTVPKGYTPVELKSPVKYSSPLGDYHAEYSFAGGILTAKRKFVISKRFIETKDYAKVKQFYNSMVTNDEQQLLLKASGKKGKNQ